MRLREFSGSINRCDEVLVPVFFHTSQVEALWIPVKKAEAREIIEKAKELGLEEVHAELDEEDNCLYIIEPGSEEEGAEEEEETNVGKQA
jgi:ABC-type proline/glycine betaine transport system substrate-binding protein